ncbi:MAG: plasmid mobilization relaxosome protein MobC [Oscillospiraceae bacterium]|nr:plasmid mobilization relaxosome protein MobC [Oscillospiraceae bacterium]
MSKRIRIYTKVTPEELDRIREKMSEMEIQNRSAYLRKMALDGYCVNMDYSDIKEMVSLLRRCNNNLNQYTKKANETGSIYEEDLQDLKSRLDEIWESAKEIMARLATIQ